MSLKLKRLVSELETQLAQRGDLPDAPARDAFNTQIESLKRAIDEADAEATQRLRVDVMELTAAVLSVITNVIALLK
jgi:hypothetical protein